MNLLVAVARGDLVRPSKVTQGIDLRLDAICLKAMARSQDQRYQSAGALGDDLKRWLDGEAPLARLRSRRLWVVLPLALAAICAVALAYGGSGPTDGAAAGVAAVSSGEEAASETGVDFAALELRRLRDLPREDRLSGLDTWLQQNPAHAQADEAVRLRGQVLLQTPRRTFIHPGCQGARILSDGKRALSWGGPAAIVLWDLETGDRLHRWNVGWYVQALVVSPDDQRIAFAGTGHSVWKARVDGKGGQVLLYSVRPGDVVDRLALDAPGRRIAMGGKMGYVSVATFPAGKHIFRLEGHGSRVYSMDFFGDRLVTTSGAGLDTERTRGAADNAFLIGDVRPRVGTLVRRLKLIAAPQGVAFEPGGESFLVACNGRQVLRFAAPGGVKLGSFRGQELGRSGELLSDEAHGGVVCGVAYAHDVRRVFTSSGMQDGLSGNEIRVWDPKSADRTDLHRVLERPQRLRRLDVSADGRLLVVSTLRGFELWDFSALNASTDSTPR